MARKEKTSELIIEALAIAETDGCSFEQLIRACPGLDWNEIFLEVDRLSREGLLHLSRQAWSLPHQIVEDVQFRLSCYERKVTGLESVVCTKALDNKESHTDDLWGRPQM